MLVVGRMVVLWRYEWLLCDGGERVGEREGLRLLPLLADRGRKEPLLLCVIWFHVWNLISWESFLNVDAVSVNWWMSRICCFHGLYRFYKILLWVKSFLFCMCTRYFIELIYSFLNISYLYSADMYVAVSMKGKTTGNKS